MWHNIDNIQINVLETKIFNKKKINFTQRLSFRVLASAEQMCFKQSDECLMVPLPAGVTHLTACLADVDVDDFPHCAGQLAAVASHCGHASGTNCYTNNKLLSGEYSIIYWWINIGKQEQDHKVFSQAIEHFWTCYSLRVQRNVFFTLLTLLSSFLHFHQRKFDSKLFYFLPIEWDLTMWKH